MPYANFSSHAPTGLSPKFVVSPNQYSDNGRNIGYPAKYSVYVNKISEVDGSTLVTETREVADIVGNRLYLWHRPITKTDGTVTTISVGGGGSPVIDGASTNAKSAYIVFSTLPVTTFTVTYLAAPDCINAWNVNTLQDDIMELQKTVGLTSTTGNAGIRNAAYAIFNSPSDAVISGTVPNAVYLSHLNRDIVIASTNDPAISGSLGNSHTVQIGRSNDEVLIETTGLHVVQTNAAREFNITLGSRTGDIITYKGQFSGAGPVTIGGPEWSNIGGVEWASRGYSGVALSQALTGSYYSGAMLKVHGDVAVMGGIKSVGQLVVITETGTTSVVLGDWTVQDELFVYGDSILNKTTVGNLYVRGDVVNVDNNIVFSNLYGNGTVDGLDCSEIQHSYKTVNRKRINNCVIQGRHPTINIPPKIEAYSPFYKLTSTGLVGEIFLLSGTINGWTNSAVGAYPFSISVTDLALPVVSGTFTGLIDWTGAADAVLLGTGQQYTGIFSPGMMDPGKLWVKVTDGPAAGYTSPIYGYRITETHTVEGGAKSPNTIRSVSLYCPDDDGYTAQNGDHVILYNPGTLPYNFITAEGGVSPTFIVEADELSPLKIAFDDEIRILTASTASLSMQDSLTRSITTTAGTLALGTPTGIAYIFAQARGTDPENPPIFKSRPTSFRMPNEVVIGEVVARYNNASSEWTVLDTVCYRPNGLYDSGWLPIVSGCPIGLNSGRMIPALGRNTLAVGPVAGDGGGLGARYYFQHQLGPEIDATNMNIDFYLASSPNTHTRMLLGDMTGYNQTHDTLYSYHGQDHGTRTLMGKEALSGRFVRMSLQVNKVAGAENGRNLNMFYYDSRVVGININDRAIFDIPSGQASSTLPFGGGNQHPKVFEYARLVMRRDV